VVHCDDKECPQSAASNHDMPKISQCHHLLWSEYRALFTGNYMKTVNSDTGQQYILSEKLTSIFPRGTVVISMTDKVTIDTIICQSIHDTTDTHNIVNNSNINWQLITHYNIIINHKAPRCQLPVKHILYWSNVQLIRHQQLMLALL